MINAYFHFFNIAIEILSRIKIKGKKRKTVMRMREKKLSSVKEELSIYIKF